MLAVTLTAQAQVNADSLRSVWNDQSNPDSSRLNAVNDLTFKYFLQELSQSDSTLFYGQKMLDLATEKGLKKHQANALHNLAFAMVYKNNFDECLKLNLRSLALREEIGDKKGIGRSLSNIGFVYRMTDENIMSLKYYERSLKNFEEIGDTVLIMHVLNSMATAHNNIGNYSKAIEFVKRSSIIAEDFGNDKSLAETLTHLARMYLTIGDIPKATVYAERANEVAARSNIDNLYVSSILVLADLAVAQGNFDQAFASYQQVLLIAEESNNQIWKPYAYQGMASTYQKKGDYDNALKFFKLCNELRESVSSEGSARANALQLGTIYKLKKDGKNAVKWCEKALSLSQNKDALQSEASACECLYEAYKLLNNGTKALEFHERFLVLNDSLQKEEVDKQLQQMEFAKVMLADSIAKAEEARLIEEAHAEEVHKKNQTRNILAGGGLLALLVAGGFYSRWRYMRKSRDTISKEKDRSDNLLLNILPADIAAELKEKGKAEARDFEMVSILFTDFKRFTETSEKLSAQELVAEINICFEAFDKICEKYNIEKIKTIGDAYMAAGGLPVPSEDSVKNTVLAALEMQEFMDSKSEDRSPKAEDTASDFGSRSSGLGHRLFEMRVGIHTGPVVAGIVGVKKFQYDIWGDTVNTASRIESVGEVGKVNISQSTYDLLKNDSQFTFEPRGKIEAKGKGEIEMWFVSKSV